MQLFKPNIYDAKLLFLFRLPNYFLILSLLVSILADRRAVIAMNSAQRARKRIIHLSKQSAPADQTARADGVDIDWTNRDTINDKRVLIIQIGFNDTVLHTGICGVISAEKHQSVALH